MDTKHITKILELETKASEAWVACEFTDCLNRKAVKAYEKAEKQLRKAYDKAYEAGAISFSQYSKGTRPMCYRIKIL